MDKTALIALAKADHAAQERFYCDNGPDKHEQEERVRMGVAVVAMNVGLFEDWLYNQETDDIDTLVGHRHTAGWFYDKLTKTERREIWEASGFHFGIYGYDAKDADFWWANEAAD